LEQDDTSNGQWVEGAGVKRVRGVRGEGVRRLRGARGEGVTEAGATAATERRYCPLKGQLRV
jgi:hypothetical protein